MSDTKKPAQEKFEADFDAFLRDGKSHLGELYRKLPHSEPDASIDARLRARARQALRENGDAAPSDRAVRTIAHASPSRARRWLPGLGAAAALVLAAGLAWRMTPWKTPMPDSVQPPGAAAPAAANDQAATAQAPAPAAESKPEPPPAAADQAGAATLYRHKLHRTITPEANGRPEADAAQADTRSTANDGMLSSAPKAAVPVSAAPVEDAAPSAFPREAEAARKQNTPPQLAAKPAASGRETANDAAAPASALAPRQAPAENQADAERAPSSGAAVAVATPLVRRASSVRGRYRWEAIDEAAAGAPVRSGVYPPGQPPLRAWIEIVRAMLRDGDRDAARQALADLRSHHPDFRVPADLHGIE